MKMLIDNEDEPMCTCDASVLEAVPPSSLPGQSFIPRYMPLPHSDTRQAHNFQTINPKSSNISPIQFHPEPQKVSDSLNTSQVHKSKSKTPLQSQNPVVLDVIAFNAKIVIKECGDKIRSVPNEEGDRRQCVKENGVRPAQKRVHKVIKRYRMSRVRRVKRQEYRKLKEMVPALQVKSKVSKVEVIEEAIKYIDELHSALVTRFRARGLPTTLNGVLVDPRGIHDGNIRDVIRRLLANANPTSLPPSRIENVRMMPTFLNNKRSKHKLT